VHPLKQHHLPSRDYNALGLRSHVTLPFLGHSEAMLNATFGNIGSDNTKRV
jgi:hypothetical protein